MKSPYRYCSRCGEELSNPVREYYEENHESGPVLCLPCIQEILHGIPDALQSIVEAVGDAVSNAFGDALRQTFTDEDNTDH